MRIPKSWLINPGLCKPVFAYTCQGNQCIGYSYAWSLLFVIQKLQTAFWQALKLENSFLIFIYLVDYLYIAEVTCRNMVLISKI